MARGIGRGRSSAETGALLAILAIMRDQGSNGRATAPPAPPWQCAMPVSNQRHPACKAKMRFLETLQRNGFKGASEHAGKLCGNFQYQLPAGEAILHYRDPPRSHGYPYRLIGPLPKAVVP
jgi:hypothetical protein